MVLTLAALLFIFNFVLKKKRHFAFNEKAGEETGRAANGKERKTIQVVCGKDAVVTQDGIIDLGGVYRVCLYVTQVNMRTNTDQEKFQVWTFFRSFLNEIGLPYTFVQLSQFVDVREYAQMYQESLERGHLTAELYESGLKVVKSIEGMDENRNSRDYHGYVMFQYYPESDSIDSGVATGNAKLDELIGKFSGKKLMSEVERKNLSRMMLEEAVNIAKGYAEQMGMQCFQLRRGQVYGLAYKILQKDSAGFSSPEEASDAQCFTPFHDSLTAKMVAWDLPEDYSDDDRQKKSTPGGEAPVKRFDSRKAQPGIYDGKPEAIDFVAPSVAKELLPNDVSDEAAVGEYMAEVGGTSTFHRYYRSFFAEIMSGNTWGGMLDDLARGNFGDGDTDIALHVRPASTDIELQELGRRLRGLLSDISMEGDPSKIDSMRDEVNDIKARQKKLRMEIERSFKVSLQVIASGTDLKSFKMYCNALVKRFNGKSIYLRPADGKQLEALQAILPIAQPTGIQKEHFVTLESSNLADLFPFAQGGITHKTGVILGRDGLGRPVYFDQWHPSLPCQHMIILGRTGAGKTYTTQIIMHRSMHIGRVVAAADWKGEHKDWFLLSGLPYLEFSEHSPNRVNPYDVEITEDADGTRNVDIESVSNNVQALVFRMISTYDRSALTGQVKVFIGGAIRRQYEEAGIRKDPKSLYQKSISSESISTHQKKSMPELGGLYLKMAESEEEEVRRAAELLKPFTQHGNVPSYSIFDGQSTVELKGYPGYGFALNKLDKDIMRPIGLSAVAIWLNENFAKADVSQEKIIVLEEAQNLFDDPDVGGPFSETAYREYRAMNTGVCAVTQGLEVLRRSKAGIAAVKNSPIKIIGKQEDIDIETISDELRLSEGEAAFLLRAKKGEVIMRVEDESDIVFTQATDYEHMMFTTDPNDPAFWQRKEVLKQKLGREAAEAMRLEQKGA